MHCLVDTFFYGDTSGLFSMVFLKIICKIYIKKYHQEYFRGIE
jgi:hypothetical protein